VTPTRLARHGTLYTPEGLMGITNAGYREDFTPVDADCTCYTCAHFTRAYLRHLFVAGELLAYTLATIHNLAFILGLMRRIREAIPAGALGDLRQEFSSRWKRNAPDDQHEDDREHQQVPSP
jgi:queuine tRNA-ribosyltransferase